MSKRMDFSAEQLSAINAENRKIIVSAGAGSGKSTAMTERVMRLIEKTGVTLDHMLVITFTRDAASSMRKKIYNALRNAIDTGKFSKPIYDSYTQMPFAQISTIHSFCASVIRESASLVNVSTDFRNIEDAEKNLCFEEAVKNAIEAIAEKTYPAVKKNLFGAFKRSVKAGQIKDICQQVYDTIMGIPDPFTRLNEVIGEIGKPGNAWEREITDYYKLVIAGKRAHIRRLEELYANSAFPAKAKPVISDDVKILNSLISSLEKTDDPVEVMYYLRVAIDSTAGGLRKPSGLNDDESALYEEFKTIHGYIKNAGKDKNYLQFILKDIESVVNASTLDLLRIQKQLQGLAVLLEEVANQYEVIKAEKNSLDYADLEQLAYRILTDNEHPDALRNVQEKYPYIFVDEFQDVSAIQYAIVETICGERGNAFYVGDIKQSIYRFRHADPMLFQGLRDTYREDETAAERKIFFRFNYRSSATIIDCVNDVFGSLLSKKFTEIDYEAGDVLLTGETKDREPIPCSPTDIVIVNSDIPDDPATGKPVTDELQAQCVEVGERIAELVKSGYEYKDIVILLRSAKNRAELIKEWLTAMHIPAYYGGKVDYFKVPEVAMMIEILKTINNSYQDYPLIATLRNVPFNFTDDELAEIRLPYNTREYTFAEAFHLCAEKNTTPIEQKCRKALDRIERWQTLAEVKKTSAIIWMLLKEENIYAYQGAMPDGELRQKNLYALHDRAMEFERTGSYKLAEFLYHIKETRQASAGSDEPVPMSENDNFVRIMTIHSSKGLEFPVVILMDMHRNVFHADNNKVKINIEIAKAGTRSLGLYMPYTNLSIRTPVIRDCYGKMAFRIRTQAMELAEQARLLYVAMTRAEKKLIMIGNGNVKKMDCWYEPDRDLRLINTTTTFDMVMPTVLKGQKVTGAGFTLSTPEWNVEMVEPKAIKTDAAAATLMMLPAAAAAVDFGAEWDKTRKDITELPAKTAVTYILKGGFDGVDEDTTAREVKASAEADVGRFELGDEMERPAFIENADTLATAAELGTATHRFLSLLSLKKVKEAIDNGEPVANVLEEELRFMEDTGSISEELGGMIRRQMLKGIEAFLLSGSGRKALDHLDSVRREQGFVCKIHAAGHEILVQGVIDLMYREGGEWVILDFKTDSDTREESVKGKHTDQLNYYRQAVENITGEGVGGMYVVAIRNGQTITIPRARPEYS